MKKRNFICVMMAVAMILSGVSCGDMDKSEDSSPSPGMNFAGGAETAAGGATAAAADEAPTAEAGSPEAAPTEISPETNGAIGDADLGETEGAADGADAKKSESPEFTADTADGLFEAADGDFTDAAPADAAPGAGDTAVEEPVTTEEPTKLPEVGLLTAGEWSDNENWGFFTNLVNTGAISYPVFGLDPTMRTAVTVKDGDGKALVNAKVLLKNGDSTVWSAVTDKNGMAYLFGEGSGVEVNSDGKTQSYELKQKTADGGQGGGSASEGTELEVTFDGKDKLYNNTDIMFIVDSTGSMSDEMLFLQSEFSALTKELGTDNIRYSVNFYRDEGDDYVTKLNDFTNNIDDIQSVLNSEIADGGGDYPEAVGQILEETITNGQWADESVKIAFMIFDAPPHEESQEQLIAAAQAAGEKGIRIIPIVSSDSDLSTELFARSLAIMSGGTYVFLTDDSGIGNSHLEPIIGSYEVEKLYDIIIRVVNEYRQDK